MHNNWDDLRYILAVARHGSLAAAARALGVNHSTVLRRVNAYESDNSVSVFARHPTGYQLTDVGRELVDVLLTVDDKLLELDRKVAGRDVKLEGRVRITTTDSLSLSVVVPHLRSLHERFPLITPELSVTNGHLNFARRDADITVRPCVVPPDELTGTRIAALGFRLYASAEYLEQHAQRALHEHPWLVPGELMDRAPPMSWIREQFPHARFALRADSFVALGDAARAGMGVALLPCCLERVQPGLVALDAPQPDLGVSVWVLMHRDLQRSAPVRACVEHLTAALQADAKLLAGS